MDMNIKTTATRPAGVPNTDAPKAFREMMEKSTTQIKENYETMSAATTEAADLINNRCSTAAKAVQDYNDKCITFAKANINATLSHAIALISVKTLPDAIELQTAFVRKQVDTMTVQFRELGELTQKVGAQAAASVKTQFEKTTQPPG
jgi:phasin